MSEALRLADALEDTPNWQKESFGSDWKSSTMKFDRTPFYAAVELRRLHAENEALKAELLEQARVNGMGGERQASLMAELERKSDAIQRLWKERDELRSENRTLVRQNGEWQEHNAELVEALRHINLCSQNSMSSQRECGEIARAALAKAQGESNGKD